MRAMVCLVIGLFIFGAAQAAPFRSTVFGGKQNQSGVKAFKKKGPKIELQPVQSYSFLAPGSLIEPSNFLDAPRPSPVGEKGLDLLGFKPLGFSHKLYLESQYADIGRDDLEKFENFDDYGKILKSTSLGIAYPLTRKLTLDGRYAIIKQENVESLSPYLGATYRFSTATSISLSYRHDRDQNAIPGAVSGKDASAAELKIHF